MSTRTAYLLPCTCGEKILVDKSQAGLPVPCRCGKELTIPTLRGFAQLEQTTVDGRAAREWSSRQGVHFIGAAIAVLGLLAAGWFALGRPQYPHEVESELIAAAGSTADMQNASVESLRKYWRDARVSVENDPSPYAGQHLAMLSIFQYAEEAFRARMTVAAIVTAVGATIFCVGFLLPKRPAN